MTRFSDPIPDQPEQERISSWPSREAYERDAARAEARMTLHQRIEGLIGELEERADKWNIMSERAFVQRKLLPRLRSILKADE